MKEKIKTLIENHYGAVCVALRVTNMLNLKNHIRLGKGNSLRYQAALLRGVDIRMEGTGNQIILGNLVRLTNCRIQIFGNNNLIRIGDNCFLEGGSFWLENDGNEISVGAHTFFHGDVNIAALEGSRVIIGEDCLFARAVDLRTGDSHSILDKTGGRINPAADIVIGNHCWFGTRVLCMKGTTVADGCVVGAGALLAGKYDKPNCILAGVPAKVKKEEISWTPECV